MPMNPNNNKTQRIVKVLCPHCSTLCSPQIKYCLKCGEPLPENCCSEQPIIPNNLHVFESQARKIIKFIEKEIQKPIPLVEKIKPNATGYTCENDEITRLNLFKCGLTTIPANILKLKSLKQLSLRRNNITELPEFIGFFSNLEMLDMRINELTGLPNSIGLLSKLKYLNLSSNQLFTIPESIGNLSSLTKLNLSNNKLRSLPESLGDLDCLKELDIKANFWITLPESVKRCQQNGLLIIK